jgi:trehalose-6-phosphatase
MLGDSDECVKLMKKKSCSQIDPFGHSGVQASLLTGLSGYHGLYFARIDYQDKANREDKSDLELIWRGSSSLGKGTQAFTGVLYYHYCPPPGLCFDQVIILHY